MKKPLKEQTALQQIPVPKLRASAPTIQYGTTRGQPARNVHAYDAGCDVTTRTHNPHAATTQADYDETEEDEGYTNPGYTRRSIIVRQQPTRVEPARRTDDLPPEPRRGLHPLVYIGASMLIIVLFIIGYIVIPPMWQRHTIDATYGNPRTYQTDKDVGHGGVSHFIVLNNNGTIEVIEIPPDPSTMQPHLYIIVRFSNTGADLIPATVSFTALTTSGRLDMLVKVYETPDNPSMWILFNNGTEFKPHL